MIIYNPENTEEVARLIIAMRDGEELTDRLQLVRPRNS